MVVAVADQRVSRQPGRTELSFASHSRKAVTSAMSSRLFRCRRRAGFGNHVRRAAHIAGQSETAARTSARIDSSPWRIASRSAVSGPPVDLDVDDRLQRRSRFLVVVGEANELALGVAKDRHHRVDDQVQRQPPASSLPCRSRSTRKGMSSLTSSITVCVRFPAVLVDARVVNTNLATALVPPRSNCQWLSAAP